MGSSSNRDNRPLQRRAGTLLPLQVLRTVHRRARHRPFLRRQELILILSRTPVMLVLIQESILRVPRLDPILEVIIHQLVFRPRLRGGQVQSLLILWQA